MCPPQASAHLSALPIGCQDAPVPGSRKLRPRQEGRCSIAPNEKARIGHATRFGNVRFRIGSEAPPNGQSWPDKRPEKVSASHRQGLSGAPPPRAAGCYLVVPTGTLSVTSVVAALSARTTRRRCAV